MSLALFLCLTHFCLPEEFNDISRAKSQKVIRKGEGSQLGGWVGLQTDSRDCCLSLASNSSGTEHRVWKVGTWKNTDGQQATQDELAKKTVGYS